MCTRTSACADPTPERISLAVACLVFNALDTAGLVVWGTTRHRLVPVEMRGRVASFRALAYGLWPLSYALTGPAAALFGVRATLVVAGLAGGLITIGFLFLPGMRDVERDERLRTVRHEPAAAEGTNEALFPDPSPEVGVAWIEPAPVEWLSDCGEWLPLDAASMTPARSNGGFRAPWRYIAVPIVGVALAGLTYQFLRGERPAGLASRN